MRNNKYSVEIWQNGAVSICSESPNGVTQTITPAQGIQKDFETNLRGLAGERFRAPQFHGEAGCHPKSPPLGCENEAVHLV